MRILGLILVISLVLGSIVFIPRLIPGPLGNLEARYDLFRDRPSYKLYGLPTVDRPEFEQILWEKYRIRPVTVAGCIVADHEVRRWDAYNSNIESWGKQRYGIDPIDESTRLAAIAYTQKSKTRVAPAFE